VIKVVQISHSPETGDSIEMETRVNIATALSPWLRGSAQTTATANKEHSIK